MPLPLKDVGEGFSTAVHCRQREPKEPHFSSGHEVDGPKDYITLATIHHRVASRRMRSSRQPGVPPSLQHQALHGIGTM